MITDREGTHIARICFVFGALTGAVLGCSVMYAIQVYLLTLKLDGRHAKATTIEFAGQLGPETLKKVEAFMTAVLFNDKERLK